VVRGKDAGSADQPAALVLEAPPRQNGLLQMGNGLGPLAFLCALYQGPPGWYGNNEGRLDVTVVARTEMWLVLTARRSDNHG
jgi:hypothetical protein